MITIAVGRSIVIGTAGGTVKAGATIAVTGTAIEIDALTGVIETMIAVSAATEGRAIIGIAICFKTGRMPVIAMSVVAVKL